MLFIPPSLGMTLFSTRPGKGFWLYRAMSGEFRTLRSRNSSVRGQSSPPYSVYNTLPVEGNLTMTKILTCLLIAAAMSCSVVFAQDNLGASKEDGQKRVEFALYGKFGCVLVDGKVFCARGVQRAPVKLGAPVSN